MLGRGRNIQSVLQKKQDQTFKKLLFLFDLQGTPSGGCSKFVICEKQ